jgi:hypothetical protein
MQQIADWLQKQGLGQYAERFAENDIDVSVLRYLTDADLEKIGISLGHRRKILAAIAELPHPSPSKHEPVGGVEPKPQEAVGERRQVTVMFSDLVGSTALSTRMDPKTSAKSFRPTRSLLQKPSSASAASWQSTWAMACWFTSATRRHTKTMLSAPCVQDWSWSLR